MSIRSTTITPQGRVTRRNIETLLITLVALAVTGWALTEFGRQQTGTGPNGSVFVTDVNGGAALAELLEDIGHPVVAATAPFDRLDRGGTVFILDPSLRQEYLPTEIGELRSWLSKGGRLVISGRPHPELLGTVLPEDLRQGFDGRRPAQTVTPLRGVDGPLDTAGIASVRTEASNLVLAGDPPVAVAFGLGDGIVIYIADGSMFWNERIDTNAAWVVSLVADGPVRFDELRHGFAAAPVSESPTGLLAALPVRVRNTVLLLMPVLTVALVTYGRRFGPPEQTQRELAPPRKELVDAMAGLLIRTDDPLQAGAPVIRRLRSTLTERAGLSPDAADDVVAASADRLGVDPERLRRALHPIDEDGMVEAQRLLAELSERDHT